MLTSHRSRKRTTRADLQDGESTQRQGSGGNPYGLKNIGGVYSCTCPGWRNQSAPIERRTCKHLRKLWGEQAGCRDGRAGHQELEDNARRQSIPGFAAGFRFVEDVDRDDMAALH